MVFIRTDSNSTISGGHIMRCLAIAKTLIENGQKVTFLIADDNPAEVLMHEKIPYVILNSNWQDLMSDVEQTRNLLIENEEAYLLIDTYSITKQYVECLKPYAKVGYLGSKYEYLGELDFLINYSSDIDYSFYENNYGTNTKLLLGIKYAPLGKEFQNNEKYYRQQVKNVLITTGNTDNDRFVDVLLDKLSDYFTEKNIIVNVIVGRIFKSKEHLHIKYDGNTNIILHENVLSMSKIMKICDLAISANGTTVYELSAMGVPTISFAMVEEQVKSAEGLNKLGVVDYCGKSYQDITSCVELIVNKVMYYLEYDAARIRLAKKAHSVIDGYGCQKIIDELF